VIKTTSGYTGGQLTNPTYEQVSSGTTGHFEAIQITYNPAKVTYEQLLAVFWHNIDPTDAKGQFCDKGDQYRSAIFYQNEPQKRLAEQSKATLDSFKPFSEPIVTLLLSATEFFPAEDYHQDYYQKNPVRYKYYRFSCGRDQRLKAVWGDH
jgi:peptide-methionine (S)-S-oxide reductase